MREIKFRAWHKTAKEMFIEDGIKCRFGECLKFLWEKQPVEVMQYTGLKDKNGKEIYEGDILCIKTKDWSSEKDKSVWNKEIVWIKCQDLTYTKAYFDLEAKRKWDNDCSWEDWDDSWEINENIEVIGNIYENPELLGDKI